MKKCFKVSLYDLLSKDKRICRFKEFHDIEVKTIMFFLMQVGYLKNSMTKNFKNMLYLNENICIKKTYISYIESQKSNEIKELDFNLGTIDKEIKKYKRLKRILLKYIEKIDLTENHDIVVSFKSLLLYEESIQKLYEEGAKDKEKISEILEELRR